MIFIHQISLIALIEQGKNLDRIDVTNLSQNAFSCNVKHLLHAERLSKSSEYCSNYGHLKKNNKKDNKRKKKTVFFFNFPCSLF